MKLSMKRISQFRRTVFTYYKEAGRDLPWRNTHDPYKILVSEMMLQQTQVERVIPKYSSFTKKFPNIKSLALAPLVGVLREWQGLGYNRRARMLHECAKVIAKKHHGRFPRSQEVLKTLPGVGPYTSGALLTFAFNKPVIMIETNIRSVFIHHFFKDLQGINDRALLLLIEQTLDTENPREWYQALMDYGSYIKKRYGNPNTRSTHYQKQSIFRGSDREIRGMIVRKLSSKKSIEKNALLSSVPFQQKRVSKLLTRLETEGLIEVKGKRWQLHK